MEGVMMRGERVMAIAVRDPWGKIVVETESLPASLYSVWSKIPLLRGLVMLWDALGIGMKAMLFSTLRTLMDTCAFRMFMSSSKTFAVANV